MYKIQINEDKSYLIVRDSDGANIPTSLDNRDYREFLTWLDVNGKKIQDLEEFNPKTNLDKIREIKEAINRHLDIEAMDKDFNSILSAVSYNSSKNITWATVSNKLTDWRDDVWEFAEVEMEKANSGQRELPLPKDFINELPKIIW